MPALFADYIVSVPAVAAAGALRTFSLRNRNDNLKRSNMVCTNAQPLCDRRQAGVAGMHIEWLLIAGDDNRQPLRYLGLPQRGGILWPKQRPAG